MPTERPWPVPLTGADIEFLLEALDSHEYWQLSEPAWRHSGAVILPSDDVALWSERSEITAEERGAIVEIERCRELADRLRRLPSPHRRLLKGRTDRLDG